MRTITKEVFERTGDAKYAFETGLDTGIAAIQKDVEYQYSKEAIKELIEANEYEFYANGEML